jgi:succinylglutamic semialdehyde dehydrogenase
VSEDPGDLAHPVGEIRWSPAAVPAAAAAAKKAFASWSRASLEERGAVVGRFAKKLKEKREATALLVSREMGKPLEESRAEVDRVIAKAQSAREEEPNLIRPSEHDAGLGFTGRVRFRPRGVIAILAPFNVPLHLASSQTISALMTGNTVVLKPSELTPFTGQTLADLWQEAGAPDGVFNLVQGGPETGKALVSDANVAGILFTGSWKTGSAIQASLANEPHKICALEMGGKNAAIVLADAPFETAVNECVTGAYMTTGQRCNATARIIVEKSIAPKFIDAFAAKTDAVKIGYATDPGVFMGPLASAKILDHVRKLTAKAAREGFKVLRKGGTYKAERKGHYLRPSVHLREGAPRFGVRDESYADEEALGPDTAIYVVPNLEEALRLNNRPRYGLVTSVFTASDASFRKIFEEAETGVVNWNAATVRSSGRLPFGGLKRSGNNRPAGFFTPFLCTIPTASLERNP